MKQRLEARSNSHILPIVCCVVLNENQEVLFLKRHANNLGGGKWGFPGGKLRLGEKPREAAVRELQEETGIRSYKLIPIGEHEVHMPHGVVHMTTYRTFVKKFTPIKLDPEEHEDFCWLTPEATLKNSSMLYGVPSLLRDFGLLNSFSKDPTLPAGSSVINLK